MEVARTPPAIRHTLSAFAAAALVFAAASGAVAGQPGKGTGVKVTIPNGIATKNSPQQTPTTHYQWRWWYDYSGASKSISDPGRIKSLSLSDEQ